MVRREISQWNKDEMARLMFDKKAVRIDVREIGAQVATHRFVDSGYGSADAIYSAIVAFFIPLHGRVGSVYLLLESKQ